MFGEISPRTEGAFNALPITRASTVAPALTLNGVANYSALFINGVPPGLAAITRWITFQHGASFWNLFSNTSDNDVHFYSSDNGGDVIALGSQGAVAIGPPQTGQIPLSVTGISNSDTLYVHAGSTAGQSFGIEIDAGTNASDYALIINDQTGANTFLTVNGAGSVSINAPSAGAPLVIKSANTSGVLSIDIWSPVANSGALIRGMNSTGATRTGYLNFLSGTSGVGGATETILSNDGTTANDYLSLATQSTRRIQLNGTGTIAFTGLTTMAVTVGTPLTVNGANSSQSLIINGGAGTGTSFGLVINAGTNASDTALSVRNATGATIWVTVDGTGLLSVPINGIKTLKLAMNSQTPVAVTTGFGTPTGNVIVANFPGATATLVQCSNTISELLVLLKAFGLIAT